MSCITNTEDFFPAILEVRNPYNNIPLSLRDLYNFYFFLKTQNYGIPVLLHGFFMSNFSVPTYIMDYEILLRDKAIKDHVMRGTAKMLYPSVFRMLLFYNKCFHNIQIAKGFPMKTLVDVMRPYLLLYFYVLHYAQDFPKRFESEEILERRLNLFDYICPNFGSRVRSTSILHVMHIPNTMDDASFHMLFSEFGEVIITPISPIRGDDIWASRYVAFRSLDSADSAFSKLQGYCYEDIEVKNGMKINRVDRIPRRETVRIEGLHPPRVSYSASYPAFHKVKSFDTLTPVIPKILTMTDEEDILFNCIEEYGTVDAWCGDNDDADDIDDGMYVGQYYSMLNDRARPKFKRSARRRFRRARSPSESVMFSSDEENVSTGEQPVANTTSTSSDCDIDHEVMMAAVSHSSDGSLASSASIDMSIISETDAAEAMLRMTAAGAEKEEGEEKKEEEEEEEEEEEDIYDMLSHDMATLSMSDVRVDRHLHTVNTIYGRLNEMISEHDVAIRVIDEENEVMTDASDSDIDSDDDL
jgi:ribosomal protein L12E/L44/L45/RPP1/RPP2